MTEQQQQDRQTREAPVLTMRALVVPSSIDEKARTVDVTWSTGAEVQRRDYWTGERYIEALSMDPKHIRLGRLNSGAPVLDSHSAWSTRSVLGVVESARVEKGQGVAKIRFSERADVDAVWQDVKGGILRSISVGYAVHKWDVQKAAAGKVEKRTAVDWEPHELSIVPIPADAGAQVRAQDESHARAAGKDGTMTTTITDDDKITAERKRVAAIDELCRMHGIDGAQRSAWIADGAELGDVREAILATLSERSRATHISPIGAHSGGGVGREQSMVRDASDALARRAGVKVEGDGHRHFGDARLLDVARRVLESGGVRTSSLSGNEIARRALSTSDFASILGAAGDKIVRNAYSAIPLAHREVLRKATAVDFRARHSVSNASANILPEVAEGEPYPRQAVDAEKASYALKTYGSIIAITRQMIVNDDFSMVESAARQRGRSAAETERKVVWDFILGNPLAPDGVAMFDNTAHGNYPAASGTPIDATTLAAARKALRTMKSPDGFAINALLKHIVVAPAGEVAFDVLLNGAYVPTSTSGAMTERMRNVALHVEPLISDTKKHWLGFTDYDQCSHFEYAYLSGSDGVRVEQRIAFENDCLELKCVLDFGIGAIDHRGVYYVRET